MPKNINNQLGTNMNTAVPEADAGDEDQSPGRQGEMNNDLKSFRSSRGSKPSVQAKKTSIENDRMNGTINSQKSLKNRTPSQHE